MEYLSTTETARIWGVSLRQVQRLLVNGRILGAQKYGRLWMIPAYAAKPIDLRKERKLPQEMLSSDLNQIIVATTVPMPCNNPDAIIDIVSGRRLQLQYEGELAYLRGDFEKTMRCFIALEGDNAARLRACPAAIAAAISLGDYRAYTEIETYLKECVKINKGSDAAVFADLALVTAAVSVIVPNMVSNWLREGDFSGLVPQAKPDALYLRAKYFHCINQNDISLAIAQTALILTASERGFTMPDIYLKVTCAVACFYLERADEARRWLLEAMHMALPHGFIVPFAEVVTALGGLVEQCLEQEFPEYYDDIIEQWQRTWKNWVTFHNKFTKDNITLVLSLREYHIARMVARHIPYATIAKQYCISVGRLKNIMLEIYEKLFISGRDELAKYVF